MSQTHAHFLGAGLSNFEFSTVTLCLTSVSLRVQPMNGPTQEARERRLGQSIDAQEQTRPRVEVGPLDSLFRYS